MGRSPDIFILNMKTIIVLLIIVLAYPIYCQKAYGEKPLSALEKDSSDYYAGIRYYKLDKVKKAKNTLVYIFFGEYNKWCDSSKKFIKAIGKSDWLNIVNELALNGYTFQDSLFWVEGKSLFTNEEYKECRMHFARNRNYEFERSIYKDSAEVLKKLCSDILDSLNKAELEDKKKMERKWVYVGDYYDEDKYGNSSYYAYKTFYDENNLLYEGDSVCVMLKVGELSPAYRYVSVNLITRHVHGIDASSYWGKSYNYVWDGDWWKDPESDFSRELFNLVKK